LLGDKSQLFAKAKHLYENNQFFECEILLKKLINDFRTDREALSLLANLYIKNASHEESLKVFNQLINLDPKNSTYYFQKANLESALGNFPEAIFSYSQAILINPDHADYLCNFGFTLIKSSAFADALNVLNHAIRLEPNNYLINYYLGLVFFNTREFDHARSYFDNATKLCPNFIHSKIYKARCHIEQGNFKDAINSLQSFLVEAQENLDSTISSLLGICYINVQDFESANYYFTLAIKQDPNSSENFANLSGAQFASGNLEHALKNGLKAKELDPNNIYALNNLGSAYLYLGEIELAIEQFESSIKLNPNNFSVYSNKLFGESMLSTISKEINFNKHCEFGEALCQFVKSKYPPLKLINEINAHKKLRIGFVSGDFRDHAVANFIDPILKFMDLDKFQLFAFSNYPSEDHVTLQLRSYFSSWHNIFRLSDYEVAKLIQEKAIDILIDLSGHTGNNRLPVFAIKPSPIQISWIGYPLTTGLKTIDYTFLDYKAPSGVYDKFYTEKIVYLPYSWPFKTANPSPAINQLPALVNGHLTLGIFNNARKFNDYSINLWAKVLRLLPDAKLIMAGISNDLFRKNLLSKLNDLDIKSERITTIPQLPLYDFLELHHKVDFCLDTYPYTGGTTTAQSLWMGVPVLTLRGDTVESNQTTSHLLECNLREWSCTSPEELLKKVSYWSVHHNELNSIRRDLRLNFLNQGDIEWQKFSSSLGDAFVKMWTLYCNNVQPQSFRIERR
jgi:predicted O-linked N-acetylglucosamine transferase (SPINDLY family)